MSNGLKRKAEAVDIEAAAEKVKQKRVETCMNEVNAVLEKYRCDVRPEIQIGEQWYPVSALLVLPTRMAVVSK